MANDLPIHQMRTEGPTPAGGAYAIGSFSYNGVPCERQFANHVEIVEFTTDGRELAWTVGELEPDRPFPAQPEEGT